MRIEPGYRVMLGGFIVHLCLGTLYLWAVISPAVTAHLRSYEPDLTYHDTLMVYASALGTQGIFMLVGGLLERLVGCKYATIVGAVVLTVGTFLASEATSLRQLIIYDGIFFGLGIGLCYSPPITAAIKWMPEKKGVITGTIVAGFGGGALLFGQIARFCLNPGNDQASVESNSGVYFESDSEVANRVPSFFVTMGIIFSCLFTTGCALIDEPPEDSSPLPSATLSPTSPSYGTWLGHGKTIAPVHTDPSGAGIEEPTKGSGFPPVQTAAPKDSSIRSVSRGHYSALKELDQPLQYERNVLGEDSAHGSRCPESARPDDSGDADKVQVTQTRSHIGTSDLMKVSRDVSPGEILKSPHTWHLGICFFMTTTGGLYFSGTFKTYAMNYFNDDVMLTNLATVASLFNAGGRIWLGFVGDRFGHSDSLVVCSAAFGTVILTYPLSVSFGSTGFCFWTLTLFLLEGSNFCYYMPLTVALFGVKHSSANFGIVFTIYAVLNVANISLLSYMQVSFQTAAIMMGVLCFCGCLNLMWLCRRVGWSVRLNPCSR